MYNSSDYNYDYITFTIIHVYTKYYSFLKVKLTELSIAKLY